MFPRNTSRKQLMHTYMKSRQPKKLFLSAISHRNVTPLQVILSRFEIIASCMAYLKVHLESSNRDNKFNVKTAHLRK